jgi:hypothetical protein
MQLLFQEVPLFVCPGEQIKGVMSELRIGKECDVFTGPWIAGGAARAWCLGEEVKTDVDVFCLTLDSRDNMYSNPNLIWTSYKAGSWETVLPNDITVQLIKKTFDHVHDLFRSFPFTVCQFAYCNGWVVTTKEAVNDWDAKVLRLPQGSTAVLNREFYDKYIAKGFKPVDHKLEQAIMVEHADFSGE